MNRLLRSMCVLAMWCGLLGAGRVLAQQGFTIEQMLSAPYPENLVAAKTGSRIAWTVNQQGKRNVYVAEGPTFAARQATQYNEDEGGELSEVGFSDDGNWICYVRGEGKNVSGEYANPTSNPAGMQESVWAVPFAGGEAKKIDEGRGPHVSKTGWIVYVRGGQMYLANVSASDKPKQVVVRGHNEPMRWSPDGKQLLFVSNRGDHSFVGIYDAATAKVRFLAPTVDLDSDAIWSADGKRVAFVRRPAELRDAPVGYFVGPDKPNPWAIWVADAMSGEAQEIWNSGAAAEGSYPEMAAGETGGGILNWAADDHIVFASEQDGWQHLYSIGASGGAAKLLTPGNCEVEQWAISPDAKMVVLNSNCGDVDRRHLWRVSATGGTAEELTKGDSIEWSPAILGDGETLAYLGSDWKTPPRPFVGKLSGAMLSAVKPVGDESWPKNFPSAQLVRPQPVEFKSEDGFDIHGQLFLPKNLKPGEKRTALIFMHGGPVRQMLLGFHYMFYYSNSYAMNQYLASRGYIVLSVNYRSGIGYGRAFRVAAGRAGRGATEYRDIVAAGKYLATRNDVDAKRIGLWGGSYGGYLTALGLARNSDMFAAGVDFHGVHDWPTDNWEGKNLTPDMVKMAHTSSPDASIDTWKSPVLLIHGDDDRNVFFTQTVDLAARLRAKGVHVEMLILPDEVHDFLLYSNWDKAYHATSDFFDRQLGSGSGAQK